MVAPPVHFTVPWFRSVVASVPPVRAIVPVLVTVPGPLIVPLEKALLAPLQLQTAPEAMFIVPPLMLTLVEPRLALTL